jgi:putative flippase GtrA
MDSTDTGPAPRPLIRALAVGLRPDRTLGKLVRYGAVSAVTTTLSLTLLVVLLTVTPWPASAANLVAQAAGIAPSYLLNRRWVWRRSGRASLGRETGPFWAMSAAGLVLSTLATATVSHLAEGLPHTTRTVVVAAASVAAYGVLWLAEFIVLDRVVFGRSGSQRADAVPATTGPASVRH